MDAKSVTHDQRARGLDGSSNSFGEAGYKSFVKDIRGAIDAREYERLDQILDENPNYIDELVADPFALENEIERVLNQQRDFWRFEKGEKWASIGMQVGWASDDVVLFHALCSYFQGNFTKLRESWFQLQYPQLTLERKVDGYAQKPHLARLFKTFSELAPVIIDHQPSAPMTALLQRV